MFTNTKDVQFVAGGPVEKESPGPSLTKLKKILSNLSTPVLMVIMRWIMDRIEAEKGTHSFSLELGNRWKVIPLKDPLGGCVVLGAAGGPIDMKKILELKKGVANMGKQYYNNEKGELCEYGKDDVEAKTEEAPKEIDPEDDPEDDDSGRPDDFLRV